MPLELAQALLGLGQQHAMVDRRKMIFRRRAPTPANLVAQAPLLFERALLNAAKSDTNRARNEVISLRISTLSHVVVMTSRMKATSS